MDQRGLFVSTNPSAFDLRRLFAEIGGLSSTISWARALVGVAGRALLKKTNVVSTYTGYARYVEYVEYAQCALYAEYAE